MTWVNRTLLGAVVALSGLSGAYAQDVAVVAIPGHPEVPVIINGRDATYRVVVGDWGLARPGAVPVVVYGPPIYGKADGTGYFPRTGHRPRVGRQELAHPPRVLPPPAPTYHRSWTTGSNLEPATIPPAYPPQVIVVERPFERR